MVNDIIRIKKKGIDQTRLPKGFSEGKKKKKKRMLSWDENLAVEFMTIAKNLHLSTCGKTRKVGREGLRHLEVPQG